MTTYRLNLNLPEETKATLEDIKQQTGMSSTDTIRRGVKLIDYILDGQRAGNQFRMYEKDGSYREVVILF